MQNINAGNTISRMVDAMSELYYFQEKFTLDTVTYRSLIADFVELSQGAVTDKLTIHIGFGRTALAVGKVGLFGVNISDDALLNSDEDQFSANINKISQHKYNSKCSSTESQWLVDWNLFDKFEPREKGMCYHNAIASKTMFNIEEFNIVFIEFAHLRYNSEIIAILGTHIKLPLIICLADSLQDAQEMQSKTYHINNCGVVAFINQENAYEKHIALDRISAAILVRGLICIDIDDLARVISKKISVCLHFSCDISEYLDNLINFTKIHHNLISNSPGLFVVMCFDETISGLLEIIDIVISHILNIATQAEILFAADNLMPASTDKFELTIIVNV
jgi:hypothetical protein